MAPCVTMFGPWLARPVERGHFPPSSHVDVTTSRPWHACTASRDGTCLMARGSLSANLLLGHRTAFQSIINRGYWFEGLHLLPEVKDCRREFKERMGSAVVLEQGGAGGGLKVLLRQKIMGFCNNEEMVWLMCHITVLSGLPICFDLLLSYVEAWRRRVPSHLWSSGFVAALWRVSLMF